MNPAARLFSFSKSIVAWLNSSQVAGLSMQDCLPFSSPVIKPVDKPSLYLASSSAEECKLHAPGLSMHDCFPSINPLARPVVKPCSSAVSSVVWSKRLHE